MKVYRGQSHGSQRTVTTNGKLLAPRYASNDPRNVPFDWGAESPGARHLAEALLDDCAGAKTHRFLGREFAKQVVAKLPANWEIRSGEVEKWLKITCEVGASAQQTIYAPSALRESPPPNAVMWREPDDFPDFPVDPLKQNPYWLDRLRERIKPDELAKKGFPRPKDVRFSRGIDSNGDEAFYVYLVFPDHTPERSLAWEKIEPMVSWVRDLIWTETGERLWPYVKVKLQKQLAGGLA